MKWIKPRNAFLLNEAKIRDVIFPSQAKEVKSIWGEEYLELEEIELTDKIKQGKWKLSQEDKFLIFNDFFQTDMNEVYKVFSKFNDKFNEVITQSINIDILKEEEKERYSTILKDFNIKTPTITQICSLFNPIFRKISVSETMGDEIISKDENGRPKRDENNEIIKVKKEKGELIFSNNLVNITTFITDYNRCFDSDKVYADIQNNHISRLINITKEDLQKDYIVDFDVIDKDLYLYINHSAKDILNMSVTKFYSSCQHLYSGGYRRQVIGNVFDPNSVPAYLIFESPIIWRDEKISEYIPLCRAMVRNLESFEENAEPKIFFDRAYPDRVKDKMDLIIEKYSGNKKSTVSDRQEYLFTPDIPLEMNLGEDPYMDKLGSRRQKYIGVNVKTLNLSRGYDWSKIKVSKNAKIKEIIIETTNLPENLLNININPDWVKFKFIKLIDVTPFSKIKTNSIALDKCKFDNKVLSEFKEINPDINRLQIISCDIDGIDLTSFGKLDELHLIYTIEPTDLIKSTENIQFNKLVISSDLLTNNKENKKYINTLKQKGIKIEIIGPKI